MTQSYQTTKLISITSIIFKIFTGTLSTPTLMNFSGLVLATICITGIALLFAPFTIGFFDCTTENP